MDSFKLAVGDLYGNGSGFELILFKMLYSYFLEAWASSKADESGLTEKYQNSY